MINVEIFGWKVVIDVIPLAHQVIKFLPYSHFGFQAEAQLVTNDESSTELMSDKKNGSKTNKAVKSNIPRGGGQIAKIKLSHCKGKYH